MALVRITIDVKLVLVLSRILKGLFSSSAFTTDVLFIYPIDVMFYYCWFGGNILARMNQNALESHLSSKEVPIIPTYGSSSVG